ncbi:MAG: fluoride efflux transporter CrcB [Gallionella sp.]|nr:fluoride efflux transporter CrcB [Gallionella sp.]
MSALECGTSQFLQVAFMIYSFLAIGLGAACGAWLRWGLGLWLNPVLPQIPLGTLMANLLGGYLIGLAIAFFMQYQALSPEWRLLVITGFLGGLTTFSTFSAEAVTLLMRAQYAWAAGMMVSHLAGSILMTVLGIQTFKWLNGGQ